MSTRVLRPFLRRLIGAIAAVAALGAAATVALAQPSTDWRDYTAVARDTLIIGGNIEVMGNFGVVEPGGSLQVGVRTTVRGPVGAPDSSFVAADRVTVGPLASVTDVFANALALRQGAVVRGVQGPVTLPLLVLPPLPPAIDDPCTLSASNVVVPSGTTLGIGPGCYRKLRVVRSGRVELDPGTYNFLRWRLDDGAQVAARPGGSWC